MAPFSETLQISIAPRHVVATGGTVLLHLLHMSASRQVIISAPNILCVDHHIPPNYLRVFSSHASTVSTSTSPTSTFLFHLTPLPLLPMLTPPTPVHPFPLLETPAPSDCNDNVLKHLRECHTIRSSPPRSVTCLQGNELQHIEMPSAAASICFRMRDEGSCRFGDGCRFSHDLSRLKVRLYVRENRGAYLITPLQGPIPSTFWAGHSTGSLRCI
jgi:hypothetical protein